MKRTIFWCACLWFVCLCCSRAVCYILQVYKPKMQSRLPTMSENFPVTRNELKKQILHRCTLGYQAL